jgi:hypothetical protein
MVAGFVLIAGVILILVIAAMVFAAMGLPKALLCVVPLAPGLVMLGTFLLILTELFLLLGGREDRKAAKRDLGYLFPTLIVSGILWYAAQKLLW